jgi:PD-(D/E)XK nuclease superfamily
MNYPDLSFFDKNGELPKIDNIYHVKQYGGWHVQLTGDWNGYVGLEGTPPFILSRHENQWKFPQIATSKNQIDKEKKRNDEINGSAGEIVAVLLDHNQKIIANGPRVKLLVSPANFSDQQLIQLIQDIGLMALSTTSCVNRSIGSGLAESEGATGFGMQWFSGIGLLSTASSLLDLAVTVQNNWPSIEKRPLRSFINEVASVPINTATITPQSLIKSKIGLSKKTELAMKRVESTQCPENEFLCFILDKYLRDLSLGFIQSLESLLLEDFDDSCWQNVRPRKLKNESLGTYDPESLRFIETAKQRAFLYKEQLSEIKVRILDLVSQLKSCAEWAERARMSSFLKQVRTPMEVGFPSLRITSSLTYGPIFNKYISCQGGVLKPVQCILPLFEHTHNGQVPPTWELFEIWCMAKLYSSFILYTNMRPPLNEPILFDIIQIDNKKGTLKLPKDQEFKLQSTLDNGDLISVSFWYEPKLKNLNGEERNPDIKISITTSSKTINHCFDAKYRDYQEKKRIYKIGKLKDEKRIDGKEQLKEDVLVTAKDKYLTPLGMDTSFILHTDSTIDYWGEVPFGRFFHEQFGVESDESNFVSHKYGAISLMPDKAVDAKFFKIIRLLFQYHNSLSTVCMNCNYQLKWPDDIQPSWLPKHISENELIERISHGTGDAGKGAGAYCSCPKCGDFWIIQVCWGTGHRILKIKDSFHRNSDHPEFRGKWMYICPECGSDPSLKDIKQRKNLFSQKEYLPKDECDDF